MDNSGLEYQDHPEAQLSNYLDRLIPNLKEATLVRNEQARDTSVKAPDGQFYKLLVANFHTSGDDERLYACCEVHQYASTL